MSSKIHLIFSIAFSILVIATIVWGIALVGSPASARVQRFDQQRLSDLQTIFREIQSLCRDSDIKDRLKRELPVSLKELASIARSERIKLADPETGEPYRYRLIDETSYELCATFSRELNSDVNVFWNHPSGEHCFKVNALDPP